MKECIICRKLKSKFSDEHVIPDSLNGYYHIHTVCTDCNNHLGSAIDCTITNHKLAEFYRFIHKIKGKSGKIPNPFKNTNLTLKDDPKQKIRAIRNKEGMLEPYFLYNLSEISPDGEFTLHFDKRNEGKIENYLKGIAKKIGISLNEIKSSCILMPYKKITPKVDCKMEIDIKKFRMGLLKIAYEFAVDTIPAYYHDKKAKLISHILFKADFEALDKYSLFIGSGLQKSIFQSLPWLIDVNSNDYSLILVQTKRFGLICLIHLANMFNIIVILSDRMNYLTEDIIIGINDFENRQFVKFLRRYFLLV
ncbi:conserved hypothetical protein [Beggiatoa sp. PS]|nr:conserved hypothetical protein [Beggiatoa sp. PS]